MPDPSGTFVLNGKTFYFRHPSPVDALKIQVNVIKIGGEGIMNALVQSDTSPQVIAAVIIAGSSKTITYDLLIETLTMAFNYVSVDGKRLNMDIEFVGRPKDLWVVFVEAMRYSFTSFFPEKASPSNPADPTL